MRSVFRGHYSPTDSELEDLWTSGLVVLDTNALLNLFRYTEKTRREFLAVLTSFQESLWLPHQVGLEFHRRRLEVVQQQEKAFDEIDASITSAGNDVAKTLGKFGRHPSLDAIRITEILKVKLSEVSSVVDAARKHHEDSVTARGADDETFDLVTSLYEGRVGPAFEAERLSDIYEIGKKRYESKIPPGFKDADKPEPARYGDLILWYQILHQGRNSLRPLIFVTDDAKEDWWHRVAGKTLGPRSELVDEYFEAAQQRVHFYAPDRFLSYAKDRSGSPVSDASLTEVESVSSARSTSLAAAVLRDRHEQLQSELAQTMRILDRQRDRARQPEDSLASQSKILFELQAGRRGAIRKLEEVRSEVESLDAHLGDLAHGDRIPEELWRKRLALREALSDAQAAVRRFSAEIEHMDVRGVTSSPDRIGMYERRMARTEAELAAVAEALSELDN